jgi:hypothetical protein
METQLSRLLLTSICVRILFYLAYLLSYLDPESQSSQCPRICQGHFLASWYTCNIYTTHRERKRERNGEREQKTFMY